jgi:hypothetical protein
VGEALSLSVVHYFNERGNDGNARAQAKGYVGYSLLTAALDELDHWAFRSLTIRTTLTARMLD